MYIKLVILPMLAMHYWLPFCQVTPAAAQALDPSSPQCTQMLGEINSLTRALPTMTARTNAAEQNYRQLYDQISHVNVKNIISIKQYVDARNAASKNADALRDAELAVSRRLDETKFQYNTSCLHLPPPPAPPPPAPPAPSGIRVENVGNRTIYFAVVSKKTGKETVCSAESVNSGDAVSVNIGGGDCDGQLLLVLHNSKQVVYYQIGLEQIYQIYWNKDGQVWGLKTANRE